jgi:hypothetical protein
MAEPLSTTAFVAGAAARWLISKGLDWSAARLWSSLSPKDFKRLLEKAWKGDNDLRTICDPSPTFDHQRLDGVRWTAILVAVLKNDEAGLGNYLFEEQLIDLPWRNERGPVPVQKIGQSAARVTMDVAVKVIANNESLCGEFEVFASQQFQAQLTEILATLDESRRRSDELTEEFRQHSADSAERDADHSKMLKEVLSILKPESQDAKRLSELTDDNIKLELQLMALLDEKGRTTWETINREWRKLNLSRLSELAREFELWLRGDGDKASAVIRGRGFMLLAHVALLSSRTCLPTPDELGRAQGYYAEACKAYGQELPQEERSRLARFRAKIKAIAGDHDGALEEMAPFADADATNFRLIVLIDQGRLTDAYDAIRTLPFATEWIEEAIRVFISAGNPTQADRALQWVAAAGDGDLEDRCRLAYVRSKLAAAQGETEDGPLMGPFSAKTEVQDLVDSLLPHLEPVVERVRACNCVESGNKADIIAVAYAFNRSRGRVTTARQNIALLKDYVPLHEAYARAALRGDVPCTADLAHRLRGDYPDDFSMHLLAADIDWHSRRSIDEVLTALEGLHNDYQEASAREELASLAFEIATAPEVRDEHVARLRMMCKGSTRAEAFLEAYLHVKAKGYDEAEALLATLVGEDDIVVMQLRAEILIGQDHPVEGAQLLASVGRRMSEPYFLRKAAHYAQRSGNAGDAISYLEDSLLLDPDNLQAINQLAVLRAAAGDYLLAAELFGRLASLASAPIDHKLDQARCLALAGDADSALALLDEACEGDEPPLFAVLAKAQLLRDCGQSREALETLNTHRDRGWEDPHFVHVYMVVAFSANSDAAANEALRHLLELQQALPEDEQLLHAHSVDDLTTMAEERNRTIRQLRTEMLKGRVPWVLAERLANNPAMWGWFVRTQELAWLYEDETSYASYSVYASHGYAVLNDEDEGRRILPIRCAPRDAEIVVDLSALITLDRLGILDRVLDYFGQVHIPSSYLITVLTDSGALFSQQPSQDDELQSIQSAVRDGHLKVCEDKEDPERQVVDEYAEQDSTTFKIADVLAAIGVPTGGVPLVHTHEVDKDKPLNVTLSTLRTLARDHALEQVLAACHVFINRSDFDSVNSMLHQAKARHQVRTWHTDLWKMLRTHPKVTFESALQHVPGDALDVEEIRSERIIAFESMALAERLRLPLLADERLCQAVRLNAHPDIHHSAFGTFEVLEALCEGKILDNRATDGAILQLIKWRYRFIVLDGGRLRSIYDAFGLSGLQTVASYVHDCMRDGGLLAGLENSDVPMPMAYRVYQDWERNIGHFIAALWIDGSIAGDEATEVTEWAMTELLPGTPKNLRGMQSRLAAFSPSMVLAQMLFDLVPLHDYDRANEALLCVARHLGITYEEYLRIAEGVICTDHGSA